jgi:hypothetical protein
LFSSALVLILSILFWNLAFFGNAFTCWLVIPSLFLWILFTIRLADSNQLKNAFLYGALWGILCLSPQFWWFVRLSLIYPINFGFGLPWRLFFISIVLIGITNGMATTLLFFIIKLTKSINLHLRKMVRSAVGILFIGFYFIYLANGMFYICGQPNGYPFFWPFLPLGSSKTFVKTLAYLRKKPTNSTDPLKEKLKHFNFKHFPKKNYHIIDGVYTYPELVCARLHQDFENSLKEINKNKTTLFCGPESSFPFPIDDNKKFIDSVKRKLPENSHIILGTYRTLSKTSNKRLNTRLLFTIGNRTMRTQNTCHTAAFISNEKPLQFFDRKSLCPFTELRMREGVEEQKKSVEISELNIVPVICFDFFSTISWLSKINSSDELTVLLVNETWFPPKIVELLYNFALIASAWYDKPIVYVSPATGLKLISFSGMFEPADELIPWKPHSLTNQKYKFDNIKKLSFSNIIQSMYESFINFHEYFSKKDEDLKSWIEQLFKQIKKNKFPHPFSADKSIKISEIEHPKMKHNRHEAVRRATVNLYKKNHLQKIILKFPPQIEIEEQYAKIEASRELLSTIIAQSVGLPINHVELIEPMFKTGQKCITDNVGTTHSYLPFPSLYNLRFYKKGPKINDSLLQDLPKNFD